MAKISNYLRISDAAAYLGVSKDTLRRWDRAGKLEARRHPISNFRLYLKRDLDKLASSISRGASGYSPRRSRKQPERKR